MALNHLSNIWIILDIPFINCEVFFILTWSKKSVITRQATKDAGPDADPAVAGINNPTDKTSKITDT